MSGEDFVNVRLTEFGASLKQVVVHEGGTPDPASPAINHREFVFRPGDVQRVTRAFEWERVLKPQQQDGKPLFEIVPSGEAMKEQADLARAGVQSTIVEGERERVLVKAPKPQPAANSTSEVKS